MGEIAHFVAMAFDRTDHGLVAGEPLKCPSPAATIEPAKGLWNGNTGAVAFVRTGYPVSRTTVLRTRSAVCRMISRGKNKPPEPQKYKSLADKTKSLANNHKN
jgi:hypothetical protein